jgi:hypothetical protein
MDMLNAFWLFHLCVSCSIGQKKNIFVELLFKHFLLLLTLQAISGNKKSNNNNKMNRNKNKTNHQK